MKLLFEVTLHNFFHHTMRRLTPTKIIQSTNEADNEFLQREWIQLQKIEDLKLKRFKGCKIKFYFLRQISRVIKYLTLENNSTLF